MSYYLIFFFINLLVTYKCNDVNFSAIIPHLTVIYLQIEDPVL